MKPAEASVPTAEEATDAPTETVEAETKKPSEVAAADAAPGDTAGS